MFLLVGDALLALVGEQTGGLVGEMGEAVKLLRDDELLVGEDAGDAILILILVGLLA